MLNYKYWKYDLAFFFSQAQLQSSPPSAPQFLLSAAFLVTEATLSPAPSSPQVRLRAAQKPEVTCNSLSATACLLPCSASPNGSPPRFPYRCSFSLPLHPSSCISFCVPSKASSWFQLLLPFLKYA